MGKLLAQFHINIKELPHKKSGALNFQETTKLKKQKLYKAKLPQGITHGDLHKENIRISNSKNIVALFDFDLSGTAPLLFDLTKSIIDTCYTPSNNKLSINLINSEIKGYQSIRPLNQIEIKYFEKAFNYTANFCINWFKENNFPKYVSIYQTRLDNFINPMV